MSMWEEVGSSVMEYRVGNPVMLMQEKGRDQFSWYRGCGNHVLMCKGLESSSSDVEDVEPYDVHVGMGGAQFFWSRGCGSCGVYAE